MTVGENIKRIRKEKGLTQKQLAEKCGMYESQVRRYELGKANPKLETIRKIAKALDVDVWELIEFNTIDIDDEMDFEPGNGNATFSNLPPEMETVISLLGKEYGFVCPDSVVNNGVEVRYFIVGLKDFERFVLYYDDVKKIADIMIKSTQPILGSLVENMKDCRPVDEIVNEIFKELEND